MTTRQRVQLVVVATCVVVVIVITVFAIDVLYFCYWSLVSLIYFLWNFKQHNQWQQPPRALATRSTLPLPVCNPISTQFTQHVARNKFS